MENIECQYKKRDDATAKYREEFMKRQKLEYNNLLNKMKIASQKGEEKMKYENNLEVFEIQKDFFKKDNQDILVWLKSVYGPWKQSTRRHSIWGLIPEWYREHTDYICWRKKTRFDRFMESLPIFKIFGY
jgi:hypothetical protein